LLYSVLKGLLTPVLKGYNKLTVTYQGEILDNGAYVLVVNHLSYLDPIYISVAFPRKLHFMAKQEAFKYPIIKWILPKLGAFPVNREKADIKAIKNSISILKSGKVLAIFPEGTRNDHLQLDEIKNGAAYLALKTGVPIIPAFIKGTDEVMPKGQWLIKPKKVTILFGSPIQTSSEHRDIKIEEVTEMIRTSMSDLSKSILK